MKVNLIFDPANEMSGYENVLVTEGDISLDSLCEDAECIELIASDVIGYFKASTVGPLVEQWVRKLRLHGKIIIGGVDIHEVARNLINRNVNLTDANVLLYGEQREPWQFRQSGLAVGEVAKALEMCGLRVIKKRISGFYYVVEAERKL